MNQLLRRNIDIQVLGKDEGRRRHLADLRSRNPKLPFTQIWSLAQKEIPELYTDDEDTDTDTTIGNPVGIGHPYPQSRDSLAGGNPNQPQEKRRRKAAQQALDTMSTSQLIQEYIKGNRVVQAAYPWLFEAETAIATGTAIPIPNIN